MFTYFQVRFMARVKKSPIEIPIPKSINLTFFKSPNRIFFFKKFPPKNTNDKSSLKRYKKP